MENAYQVIYYRFFQYIYKSSTRSLRAPCFSFIQEQDKKTFTRKEGTIL